MSQKEKAEGANLEGKACDEGMACLICVGTLKHTDVLPSFCLYVIIASVFFFFFFKGASVFFVCIWL